MATRAVLAPSERTKIIFGSGSAPDPAGELTSLLQLCVVKQIFYISASEYLKYTRKHAILTFNNHKFSGEGHRPLQAGRGHPSPHPAPLAPRSSDHTGTFSFPLRALGIAGIMNLIYEMRQGSRNVECTIFNITNPKFSGKENHDYRQPTIFVPQPESEFHLYPENY